MLEMPDFLISKYIMSKPLILLVFILMTKHI